MTLSRFFLTVTLLVASLAVNAQKVKYKDIYVWLSNKQYAEAEPFLKRYLKENDDNPNAFLYMGLVFEANAQKNDVLRDAAKSVGNTDSAMLFLDKAYKTITEKELKRNDEYYESFKRRDLRTGEYGVKLSDIHFFIEKKQQELRERKDKIKLINYYFVLSDSTYKSAQAQYTALYTKYTSEQSLLLQADQGTVDALKTLSETFDACAKSFDIFKTNIIGLSKSTYSYQEELVEITDFATQGRELADFYNTQLKLWDFKKWADKNIAISKNEIMPLHEQVVSIDIEINKLRQKMEKDSVSVRAELTKVANKLPLEKLIKYDDKPLSATVLLTKIAELNYQSDLVEHRFLKDSADMPLQVSLASIELASAKILDSLSSQLTTKFIDERSKDYNHYILNTYNSPSVLKSFANSLQEFAKRERALKEFEVAFRKKGLQWIVAGADSIPLALNPGLAYKHQPLLITPEKYTIGLNFKDTTNVIGYFHTITRARKPDMTATFPLVKNTFKQSKLALAKALVVSDPAVQICFAICYSEEKKNNKVIMTIAKIYRSDGLAWSNNFEVEGTPVSGNFINGELIITSSEGTSWVFDKNGKMK